MFYIAQSLPASGSGAPSNWWIALVAGVPALVVAILNWIVQAYITSRGAKNQLNAIQFQTKFGQLHLQKAAVIVRLYKLTVKAKAQLYHYVSVGESLEQGVPLRETEFGKTRSAVVKIREYLDLNAVFLPDQLVNYVENAAGALNKVAIRFHHISRRELHKNMPQESQIDSFENAERDIESVVKPLLRELHLAFQRELGVTESQQEQS